MSDLLVKLYDLPQIQTKEEILIQEGVVFRRSIAPEKTVVVNWVREHFSQNWADEAEVAFSNQPVSCFLAIEKQKILGFACYEATCKNFFGPTGVSESERGRGIGKVLLIKAIEALRELGYGYAIIGGAGPIDFYVKTVGAIPIENSSPGIYQGLLKSSV